LFVTSKKTNNHTIDQRHCFLLFGWCPGHAGDCLFTAARSDSVIPPFLVFLANKRLLCKQLFNGLVCSYEW
jgi:hypothetical protein